MEHISEKIELMFIQMNVIRKEMNHYQKIIIILQNCALSRSS